MKTNDWPLYINKLAAVDLQPAGWAPSHHLLSSVDRKTSELPSFSSGTSISFFRHDYARYWPIHHFLNYRFLPDSYWFTRSLENIDYIWSFIMFHDHRGRTLYFILHRRWTTKVSVEGHWCSIWPLYTWITTRNQISKSSGILLITSWLTALITVIFLCSDLHKLGIEVWYTFLQIP